MSKDPEYIKLRHSRQWLKLRAIAMARCKGICEICHKEKAVEAHHIIPLQDSSNWYEKQKLCFDINNVQCLCRRCHLEEHRKLGIGKARTRRITAHGLAEFKKLFFDEDPSDDSPSPTPPPAPSQRRGRRPQYDGTREAVGVGYGGGE